MYLNKKGVIILPFNEITTKLTKSIFRYFKRID